MSLKAIPKTKQALPTRGTHTPITVWAAQKAARDTQLWQNDQHFWIVQNKIYDLSSFIDSHPGGSHWLINTKGQNITQHFFSHHLNQDKAKTVLQKYFVKQATKKQQPVFTFQSNGLFRKVKNRLLENYSAVELQDTSKLFIDGCIFIVLWILSFVTMAYYQSYLLAILCGMLIFPIIGKAHNFIHMRNHQFRFFFLISGFSHLTWQIMHCISHHSYANTLIDYQIQALEPYVYYLTISPKNKKIKWAIKQLILITRPFITILLFTVIVPLSKRKFPQLVYIIYLFQIPLIYLITYELMPSLKLFATVQIVFSLIFFKMAYLGHRTGAEWTAGNVEIRDFAQHQIYASSDTPTSSRGFWSYFFHGGFNFHAIHHIFPTIDNYNLPKASAILEEQALKMGIRLNRHKSVLSGLIQVEKISFIGRFGKRND